MQLLRGIFSSATNKLEDVPCKFSEQAMNKMADQAIRNACLCRTGLQKFSYGLCNLVDIMPDDAVVMGPIKEKERILQKAVARYGGDVAEVSDVCRDYVLIDSPDKVKAIKDVVNNADFRDNWEGKGIVITLVEDFFAHPTQSTGWRGLVLKLSVDLGKGRTQKAEVQIIPRDMLVIYQTTHLYQEQVRETIDLAKAQHRDLSDYEKNFVDKHQSKARQMHHDAAVEQGYISLQVAQLRVVEDEPRMNVA